MGLYTSREEEKSSNPVPQNGSSLDSKKGTDIGA